MSSCIRRLVTLSLLVVALASVEAIEHPRIEWAFQTEGFIRGAAAVEGDTVYFGSADGFLYAVAKEDGALRWKFQTGAPIAGAPAVTGDTVIVAGRGRTVHALEAASGAVRWVFETGPTLPTPTEWNYFTAPPVVDGAQVLVPSGDGKLYALDVATGKQRWAFATGDSLRAAPLAAGGVVYQPSGDDHVYALSASDGALKWKFATAGVGYDLSQGYIRSDIFTRPTLESGVLVIGSRDANVYAIDAATGEKRWTFSYDSTWAMATTVDEGAVYVGWSTNNKITALDLATGEKIWDFDAGSHTYTTPLVWGDDVYFASASGTLHKFDKRTGERAWGYDIGAEIYSTPVRADGRIFVGTDDGRMVAVSERGAPARLAYYEPATVPAGIRGFLIDAALADFFAKRGYERIDSAAGLAEWIAARTMEGGPSVVVFGFVQIPTAIVGEVPETGALRRYLEAGGKVVWPWGIANKVTFDESGNFLAHDPSVAARLLGIEFLEFQDSGNYYARATQEGRNRGMPVWLKTSFASLKQDADVIALAHDEYGRVSAFVKKFHPRAGSGWVTYHPAGYGVPATVEQMAALERVASYGLK
jgi:FOG: WD40-like repeat